MNVPRPFGFLTRLIVVGSLVVASLATGGVAHATSAAVAPLITEAFSRDSAADVVFLAASQGDAEVAGWSITVTATPGGNTAVVKDPSITSVRVTGLTNGTKYRFTAVETVGNVSSPKSDQSAPVIPRVAGKPLAPTIDSVFGRNGSLVVDWNPAPDHGAPITGYLVTVTPGGKQVSTAPGVTTATVTGLTNGTAYTVTVVANNKIGAGKPVTKANATPRLPYAPSKPLSVSALPSTNGDQGALDVAWAPPKDDGGKAITAYTTTAQPGGKSVTVPGGQTKATLAGLDSKTAYTITVTAANGTGGRETAAGGSAKAKPGFTTGPNTVRLTPASIASISKVTKGKVVFANATAQVKALKAKQIIAVEARNPAPRKGLLRKITSVSVSGETVTLVTAEAKLNEAIDTSTLQLAPPTGWTKGGTARSLVPEARVAAEPIGGRLGLEFAYKPKSDNDSETKSQTETNVGFSAALTGQLTITPDWSMNVDLGVFRINDASVTATATVNASIDGKFTASFSSSVEPKTPLVEYKFSCVTFWIGWFPVAVCPVFTLSAKATASGSLEFTFTSSYEQTFGGKLGYTSDNGWYSNDLTTPAVTKFESKMAAQVTVKLELPANLTLLLYDFAGPGLTLTPSLTFDANSARTPWAQIDLGLVVGLTFKAPVLDLDYNVDVYTGSLNVWKSSEQLTTVAVTPSTTKLLPGKQVQLAATPVGCSTGLPITWSLGEGARGTLSNGLYTAPAGGSTEDKVIATQGGNSTCSGATGYAYVRSGPNAPSVPQQVTVTKQGANYTIKWSAPADTGQELVAYAVTVCKDTPTTTETCAISGRSPNTNLTVVGDPNTDEIYRRFAIQAYNSAGNGPPTEYIDFP